MRIATAALAALAFVGTGCDVLERVNSEKVMAATLVRSPPPPQIGGASVAPAVVASVFFGQKDGGIASGGDFAGIDGAQVTVSWSGSQSGTANLSPAGQAGLYKGLTGIAYVEGATYTFTVKHAGEDFTGSAVAPAGGEITSMAGRNVEGGTLNVDPYTSYTQIPDPYVIGRAGNALAFYAVYTASISDPLPDTAQPNCTNFPQDARGLLSLALGGAEFTASTFSLAKSDCFPMQAGAATYLIALTTANRGTEFSSNLSVASAALVGTSDAGGVVTP